MFPLTTQPRRCLLSVRAHTWILLVAMARVVNSMEYSLLRNELCKNERVINILLQPPIMGACIFDVLKLFPYHLGESFQ